MPDDLTPAEREAMERALTTDRRGRPMPPGITRWTGSTAELIEHGFLAGRDSLSARLREVEGERDHLRQEQDEGRGRENGLASRRDYEFAERIFAGWREKAQRAERYAEALREAEAVVARQLDEKADEPTVREWAELSLHLLGALSTEERGDDLAWTQQEKDAAWFAARAALENAQRPRR